MNEGKKEIEELTWWLLWPIVWQWRLMSRKPRIPVEAGGWKGVGCDVGTAGEKELRAGDEEVSVVTFGKQDPDDDSLVVLTEDPFII